MVFEVT